jgi:hypothetical protein
MRILEILVGLGIGLHERGAARRAHEEMRRQWQAGKARYAPPTLDTRIGSCSLIDMSSARELFASGYRQSVR